MIKRSKLFKDFQMPIVGLGTWQATDEVISNAVQTALSVGYRHIGKQIFIFSLYCLNHTFITDYIHIICFKIRLLITIMKLLLVIHLKNGSIRAIKGKNCL